MRPYPFAIVHAGYTVLCSTPDGWIDGERTGLFDYDTRILSRYRLVVDGGVPELVGRAQPEADSFVARYRVRLGQDRARPEGPELPEDALELELERTVGPAMRERWTVTNHAALGWRGQLWLDIGADFADVAEVGRKRQQNGELTPRVRGHSLELRYAARRGQRRLERGVRVRVLAGAAAIQATEDGIGLRLELAPRASMTLTVLVSSLVDGRWRLSRRAPGRARERWRSRRVRLEAPHSLRLPFERAIEDIWSLRNGDLEHDLLGPGAAHVGAPLPAPAPAAATPSAAATTPAAPSRPPGWVVNAGVPTFTGYFGRDTLTSGWQSSLAGVDALRGALEVAARYQATTDDPWRDAEPGKMLHELRRGPLSVLGISPRDAYYGSQTTPAIFVITLSELWHWTGEDGILHRFRDAALRATEWAERACQPGGGFLAYERRSPAGLRNQGWKDSDEGIRHADGRIAEPPIATVEEQAFHVLALERMAEILVALDEPDRAEPFLARAAVLRARWHESFWMPEEQFYALAIDHNGDQVRSITSNPGHALGTGMVPAEVAGRVADRLLSTALFSGWGVRTLADDHPSYNPLAYHLGSVWPVENATFVLGFKRYGLDDHVERLSTALLEAAAGSPDGRLPEALSGHRRERGVGPAPYPNACAPQAWSASAVIQVVQLMLGLYPFAPLRVLALVRPRLPAWLPEVTLRNVRVGPASVDLQFVRRPDGTASHKVVRRDGSLLVIPAGPPVDASGNARPWLEAIGAAALERAPGRLVRAARLAVGLG